MIPTNPAYFRKVLSGIALRTCRPGRSRLGPSDFKASVPHRYHRRLKVHQAWYVRPNPSPIQPSTWPQVVAVCYARLLHGNDGEAERLCGPVARELLRISKMSPRDVARHSADRCGQRLARTAQLASELQKTAYELGQKERYVE